jgi:hypothetical protein
MIVAALKPGPAVITAVKLSNGKIEVVEHSDPDRKVTEKALEKVAEKPAEAAVTVKRPTPSCPDCYVAANEPATQVLLSFLDASQHATWRKDRYIVTRGGLSKHQYIIAHRQSEIAAKNGRICFDVFDKDVLHFHDQTVPPEEEVLAAKLILEHREHWLRNEATCLGVRFTRVFKNPWGDHLDGVWDSGITKMIGMTAAAIVKD